jgi:hypothetical protein
LRVLSLGSGATSGLLGARHPRPSRRAAEEHDELAPFHYSITSLAREQR